MGPGCGLSVAVRGNPTVRADRPRSLIGISGLAGGVFGDTPRGSMT
jgi:hypothetical protein